MSVKSYALWAVLLLNVGLTLWKAGSTLLVLVLLPRLSSKSSPAAPAPQSALSNAAAEAAGDNYSYIGDDYPLYYPMGPLGSVALTLHSSVHFSLNASSSTADLEWGLLARTPSGFGRTRLGPTHRLFVITVYHQMHCLRKIQVALLDRADPISTHHHVLHCLNYLRQWFLCEAAASLEDGDFLSRDWENDRKGGELVCRDWERVYDVLDENYENWVKWRDEWN